MATVQCKKCEEVNSPGDHELRGNPETLVFTCAQGHSFTDLEVAEMLDQPTPKPGKKKAQGKVQLSDEAEQVSARLEEIRSEMSTETAKSDGFEASSEAENRAEIANALEGDIDFFATVVKAYTEDYGPFAVLPDGDRVIPVRVPQGYLESVRQEAEGEGKTESEWLSERMREALEGFFVSYQTITTRGQFPSPIGG